MRSFCVECGEDGDEFELNGGLICIKLAISDNEYIYLNYCDYCLNWLIKNKTISFTDGKYNLLKDHITVIEVTERKIKNNFLKLPKEITQ